MRYTLESMKPQLSGLVQWPVVTGLKTGIVESLGLLLGANIFATQVKWIRDSGGHRRQCRYFLITNQGGSYTGEGYCLFSAYENGYSQTRLVRVAICDHKRHGYSTFDERQRGWHKAKCTECGLDMSVDSGD